MSAQFSFLQANINHCAGAQDLLLQSMAEWGIDLAVACEPYYVPPLPHWVGDSDGTVAVLAKSGTGPSISLVERGSGYVVVGWGEYVVVGTYFSPNRSLAEFEIYLGFVRSAVARQSPKPTVVLGDLNAKLKPEEEKVRRLAERQQRDQPSPRKPHQTLPSADDHEDKIGTNQSQAEQS
ncbi:uncharacterized protein LOC125067528 [Vanessa atalanta]|uniref:uncharacterized protein LOC125067528 n=1 Tax=Vanessa atalanta TaxID=42275 RepID=UPI001FCE0F82|nr:uncharacterized protein LOC125067528 [Vanessa atalanta]